MRVILGIYLSEDTETNDREMNALESLLQSYGHIIDAIVVGNETLFLKIVCQFSACKSEPTGSLLL